MGSDSIELNKAWELGNDRFKLQKQK